MNASAGRRERGFATAALSGLLWAGVGCSSIVGTWESGLPRDGLSTEDRLWHIVFPLSVAAADRCVFQREDTYGLFLGDAVPSAEAQVDQPAPSFVRVRYVHEQLPAGKAGMAIGDYVLAINGQPVAAQRAEAVADQIQRLTRARIQPLTLRIRRGDTERDIHLSAVPSCRMKVKVVESPVINALSDGSHIVVTSGMLSFVRSPDQLAWVLAHEIGHHALDHAEGAKLRMMLNRFLNSTVGEAPQAIDQLTLERQADVFAAALVTRAGFDLREARRLLKWLQVYQGGMLDPSHPSTQERLAALDEMIAELEQKRARGEPPVLDEGGRSVQPGNSKS